MKRKGHLLPSSVNHKRIKQSDGGELAFKALAIVCQHWLLDSNISSPSMRLLLNLQSDLSIEKNSDMQQQQAFPLTDQYLEELKENLDKYSVSLFFYDFNKFVSEMKRD
jgi:hypothetical protein